MMPNISIKRSADAILLDGINVNHELIKDG